MSNLRTRNLHPPPLAGEDRGGDAARVQRDALACRRSTAALAAANQRRRSTPERASWDAADIRRYLKRACPSPASFSQTGHGAGRAFSRSRPRTAVTSRRPREPHSPRPPASPRGPSCKLSEIRDVYPRNGDKSQATVAISETVWQLPEGWSAATLSVLSLLALGKTGCKRPQPRRSTFCATVMGKWSSVGQNSGDGDRAP